MDGVLVVDYPPEEAADFAQVLAARDIAAIFLLAPTTTPRRASPRWPAWRAAMSTTCR